MGLLDEAINRNAKKRKDYDTNKIIRNVASSKGMSTLDKAISDKANGVEIGQRSGRIMRPESFSDLTRYGIPDAGNMVSKVDSNYDYEKSRREGYIRDANDFLHYQGQDLKESSKNMNSESRKLGFMREHIGELEKAYKAGISDGSDYKMAVAAYNSAYERYSKNYNAHNSEISDYSKGLRDYNKVVDSYNSINQDMKEAAQQGETRREEEVQKDIDSVKSEISSMHRKAAFLRRSGSLSDRKKADVIEKTIRAKSGTIKELEEELQKSREYSYRNIPYSDNFGDYAAPSKNASDYSLKYKYINDLYAPDSDVTWRDALSGTGFSTEFTKFKYINDEERQIYNYIYETKGEEQADQYLDYLEETLNYRYGLAMAAEADTPIEQILYSVPAGFDQFAYGVSQLLGADQKITPTQVASQQIRNNLKGLSGFAYDFVSTVSNMVPSILLSTAVGAINPAAGAAVGTGAMSLSAAGNAYAEKVREGLPKDQAKTYATLVGASEGLLQYLLGGVSKLGGKVVHAAPIADKLNAIDNAFLRISAKLGNSMIGEGTEEGLQEILEPVFASIVLNEEYDPAKVEDVAYSFLLGALSAGLFEAAPTISGDLEFSSVGKEYNILGNDVVNALIDSGLESPKVTESYELAKKAAEKGGKLSDFEVGKLFAANIKEGIGTEAVEDEEIAEKPAEDEAPHKKIDRAIMDSFTGSPDITDGLYEIEKRAHELGWVKSEPKAEKRKENVKKPLEEVPKQEAVREPSVQSSGADTVLGTVAPENGSADAVRGKTIENVETRSEAAVGKRELTDKSELPEGRNSGTDVGRDTLDSPGDVVAPSSPLEKVAKGAPANMSTFKEYAKVIKKEYSSRFDKEFISELIEEAYGKSGLETYDRDLHDAAAVIVESAEETDKELYNRYEDLRSYLRNVKMYISDLDAGDLNISEIRKKNFRKLNIAKGKTDIDKAYEELSEKYPEFFNSEKQSSPEDQLRRLTEVVEKIYTPKKINPFAPYTKEVINELAEAMKYDFASMIKPEAEENISESSPKEETKVEKAEDVKAEEPKIEKAEEPKVKKAEEPKAEKPKAEREEKPESEKPKAEKAKKPESEEVSTNKVQEEKNVEAEKTEVSEKSEPEKVETNESEENTLEKEISTKEQSQSQSPIKGKDFSYSSSNISIPYTPKARYKANISAISTLKKIMGENRNATPEEQAILSAYTGWGGLSEAFDSKKSKWASEYAELKSALTESEYEAARRSILDAYYTPLDVISGIYEGLSANGFTGGRILEPSAGIGRFLGNIPANIKSGSLISGVEIDEITGNICKLLYPEADIHVSPFEEVNVSQNYYDLVIGNVPFGDFPIADSKYPPFIRKMIHNYFIAKGIDSLREGGIMAVLTSSGTLDATSENVRSYFSKKADFLGAVRLPENVFKGAKGVISDIVFFKKRAENVGYSGEPFVKSNAYTIDGTSEPVNEYFISRPEMILGTPKLTSGPHGKKITYISDGEITSDDVKSAISKIKFEIEYPKYEVKAEEIIEKTNETSEVREGSIVKKDNKILKNVSGELVEVEVDDKAKAALDALTSVRDAARSLMNAELLGASNEEIAQKRKTLNDIYDSNFNKKKGYINSPKNNKYLAMDSDSVFTRSLEIYDKETKTGKKADIFYENTVSKVDMPDHADSLEEALSVSLNETGKIDLDMMAGLLGKTNKEIENQLLEDELAFLNLNNTIEAAESYLSGNVRAKLKEMKAHVDENPHFKKNIEALEKVVPADVKPEDIKVRMGATWIPEDVYSQFASELMGYTSMYHLGSQLVYPVEVKYNSVLGSFYVTANHYSLSSKEENKEWGSGDMPFAGGRKGFLERVLNHKSLKITVEGKVDHQATAAAEAKSEKLLNEFQRWIWADEGRRKQLGELYNDINNNISNLKFDGSKLTVKGSNPEIPMRNNQKDAVKRIISSKGCTLLAHRVGAGKTYTMAAAAMKLRQLGLAKKPLFTVPKHLVDQWRREFLMYFPTAKILAVTSNDFIPENRQKFVNKIAVGNYDAVIMSHEQFGMIPMSVESEQEFLRSQCDLLEASLEDSYASGRRKKEPSVRDTERSLATLKAKLKALEGAKDSGTVFEKLGVDYLFVDEAHVFKNLFYITNMTGISDLGGKDGSQRSLDMYKKVQYLQRINSGRGVVFATATPVMNSAVELYTMQRYLQPEMLKARGIEIFDAWVAQFGEVANILKLKPGGDGYEVKQSMSAYKNLPELQQMISSFADIISDPRDIPYLKIPEMRGGKRILVESEPSEAQKKYMLELSDRAKATHGFAKKGEDNVLVILNDGKKAGYSQRFIDPSLGYDKGEKINKVVSNVLKEWKDSKDIKGTQLIFCDRGTPDGKESKKGLNLYQDMKKLLIKGGIPADEIAFIHSYKSETAKADLFRKVKAGEIRVLIGSTSKMGTGMNVQDRIVAIHEFNALDRPGDLEQNEGRALRNGNMNKEVAVYVYITKKMFDSRQWDNIKRKSSFIHQIMSGEYGGREAKGDGELALSAAEISAIATQNPLILEQFALNNEITRLESLQREYVRDLNKAKQRLVETEGQIKEYESALKRMKADLSKIKDVTGENFAITIDKKNISDRKEAGKELIEIAKSKLDMSSIFDTEKYYKIGTFGGLDLYVTSKGDAVLRGSGQYRSSINMESEMGTIQALQNCLTHIKTTYEDVNKKIVTSKNNIQLLEQKIKQPFEDAEKLDTAKIREREIAKELNPTESNVPEDEKSKTRAFREASPKQEGEKQEVTASSSEERWSVTKKNENSTGTKLPLWAIIDKIKKDYGIHITVGKLMTKGSLGEYSTKDKGIRTKIAQNLPIISHELAHAVDDRYRLIPEDAEDIPEDVKKDLSKALGGMADMYEESERYHEGFAEFIRKYLKSADIATLDYPVLKKWVYTKLPLAEQVRISEFADLINGYFSDPRKDASGSIRSKEEEYIDSRSFAEKAKSAYSKAYQATVDTNYGVRRYSDAAGSSQPYILATNSAYANNIAGEISHGADLTDINGNFVGPGLKAVLSKLNIRDNKVRADFGEYLVCRHGPEALKQGHRVFADDLMNNADWMAEREKELEKKYPDFRETSEALYKFENQLLHTWGVETGLISAESERDWRKKYKHYVPLNRFFAPEELSKGGVKKGYANQSSPIKARHGSGRDIINPLDNIVDNIVKMIPTAIRNNVMRSIVDVSARATAEWIEEIPVPIRKVDTELDGVKKKLEKSLEKADFSTPEDLFTALGIADTIGDKVSRYIAGNGKGGNEVTVLINGKKKYYKINDVGLLESITSMDAKQLDGLLGGMAVISRFMTSNITGLNAIWSLFSNAPRDFGSLTVYAKNKNPIKLLHDIGEAYVQKIKGDKSNKYYKEYIALGGGSTNAYTADVNLSKDARNDIAGKKQWWNPIEVISWISDMIELGPRYATYKAWRQSGASQQKAFYEAMDVTTNFRRGGRISKQVNAVIPFFGASVQGLDKFRRWITADDIALSGGNRKKAVRGRVIAYIASSAIIAAVMYALNNYDDNAKEDYQQLSTFVKNTYFNIPLGDGKYFAIPKPRELGIVTSAFETVLERYEGGNEHAFDGFGEYAAENMLPNVLNDLVRGDYQSAIGSIGLIGVGAQLMSNKDFLGRPIVSGSVEHLLPKAQYNDRTSKVAYWIGQAFDVSPIKVDYFANAVLGGFWKYQRALFPLGSENIDPTLGVKNTYVKDNRYSQDLITRLFELARADMEAKNTYPDDMRKQYAYKMDSLMTNFYSRYMRLAKGGPKDDDLRQDVLTLVNDYLKAYDGGVMTDIQKAVYKTCRDSASVNCMPSVMPTSIIDADGVYHQLSAAQYYDYQTKYLAAYWHLAEAILQVKDKDEAESLLKAAKGVAYDDVTASFLRDLGAPIKDKTPNVTAEKLVKYRAAVDALGSAYKQEDFDRMLREMVSDGAISRRDAYNLFRSRYKSDKNNRWAAFKGAKK